MSAHDIEEEWKGQEVNERYEKVHLIESTLSLGT